MADLILTRSYLPIPATTRKAYPKHKLVCNIGVNDHPTPVKVNGKHIKSYDVWNHMLKRCYTANCQQRQPTYTGCSVAKDWHLFSNFERWFTSHYVEGWHLDKDILSPGNKVYSEETCVFVSQALNNLLSDSKAARGAHPLGVCFHKGQQKYVARIGEGVGQRHLGSFPTPLAAHQAWQLAKTNVIEAAETNDPRIRAALDRRVAQLRDDHANGRITERL